VEILLCGIARHEAIPQKIATKSRKKLLKMKTPLYKNQTLQLYNSLSGTKEIFTPIHEGNVGLYVCGPTV